MEAIVLCGGFGKRLEPVTIFTPKALLTLNGRPLVDYIVNDLGKIEDVNRIILSTNKKFEDQFNYWIELKRKSGFEKEIELVVEPTQSDDSKLGAVKGMVYAKRKAKVNGDLLVILGDNFYTFNLRQILKGMMRHKEPSIVAYYIGSMEGASKFGVVKVDSKGIVQEFEEKPARPKSSLVSTGIYFYPRESLGMLDEYVRSSGKADDIGNFIKWLSKRTQVHAIVPKSGEWFDIGSLDGYNELFHSKKNGK